MYVTQSPDGKYGVVTRLDKNVIPHIYDTISRENLKLRHLNDHMVVCDKIFKVGIESEDGIKYGAYNMEGRSILPTKYTNIDLTESTKMPDGTYRFVVSNVSDYYGVVDSKGTTLVPLKYIYFPEEKTIVRQRTGKGSSIERIELSRPNGQKEYMNTYTSDYEATKKSSTKVVAKLTIDGKAFEVTAEDLYKELESTLGGITAADAYQYHNVLSQNDVIDYEKYLNGAALDNCVIITEYALATKGTTNAVSKWVKADHEGVVEFLNVDGTAEYDVIVRKGTKGEEKTTEAIEVASIEADDEGSKKTTITVTVSNDAHYHDPENTYLSLDDTIASLKLYFTNGNFADYGYDATYGWKNFLRDYFATYYGITINNNETILLI